MSRLKVKKSVLLVIISVIIFGGLFYYLGPFSARASVDLIKIFPDSFSILSADETSWQNPEAAFSQDMGELAGFEEFNVENSAHLKFPDSIAAVTPSEEGIKSILEFFGFGVADEMKLNEIKNVQLRFSFAASGEVARGTDAEQGAELRGKLLIEYRGDGVWQNLGAIDLNQGEISNFTNGGYFLYALPIFENWQDLENLKIRFAYQQQETINKRQEIYLDVVWLEVEYEEVCEADTEPAKVRPPQIESPQIEPPQFWGKGVVKELKEQRTLYSKTFLRGDGFYRDIISIAPIHYPDENGNLEDINTNFVPSNDSEYDYEVTKGFYKTKFKKNLNSENLAEYRFHNFITKIQLQDLNWSNEKGEKELISRLQSMEGIIQGNRIKYPDGYGPGIDIEFLYHPQYFGKYLIIDNFDNLPTQNSPGNSPYLEFNFKMTLSENLDIYVDGQKWEEGEILTQEKVEFKDRETRETQFFFKETYSVDARGNKNPAPLFLKKQGSDILISKQIDKNWLEQAVYPIKADNETTIYIEGDNWDCYVGSKSGHVTDSSTVDITKTAGDLQDGYWAFPISSTILDSTINTTTFTGYLSANTSALAHDLRGLEQASCPDLEANNPGGYEGTTASYSWNLTGAGTGSKTTGNIKSVFDEWKNGYSHSDGDRFGIVIDDSGTGNNQGLSFYDTQTYATSSTYLFIDYTPPNQAPTLGAVVENPSSADGQGTGSMAGNPTNEGDEITWNATSTDPDGNDWYLAICKTDEIATTGASAPTCPGGEWMVTATTTSGSEHIATTSTSGVTATSSAWYAFACDHNTDQKCSANGNKQGTGSAAENSPFCTNHRPYFTAIENDGPKEPSQTVTWNATSSDADLFSTADSVELYICNDTSFATGASPACGDVTWCSSSAASDPNCGYSIPAIKQDTTYAAYAFVVDNHGFDASGATQGSASNYEVSNVAPTITADSIYFVDAADGDTNLDLTVPEGETTGFKVHATIIDRNSCQVGGGPGGEIATSTDGSKTYTWVYRSGVTCASTSDADPNDCYFQLADCTLGPCGGVDDDTVTTTCTFSMWYVADPTDLISFYPNATWTASIKAVDDDNASSTQESSNPSEMISYPALDLTIHTSIDYGFLSGGATSSEATTTIKAIGNVGLDEYLRGVAMEKQGDPETTIPIAQQYWYLISGTEWGTTPTSTSRDFLSETNREADLNCKKTTSTSTPATKDTYWIIKIPDAQSDGTYNGTNTITAIISETSTWY